MIKVGQFWKTKHKPINFYLIVQEKDGDFYCLTRDGRILLFSMQGYVNNSLFILVE